MTNKLEVLKSNLPADYKKLTVSQYTDTREQMVRSEEFTSELELRRRAWCLQYPEYVDLLQGKNRNTIPEDARSEYNNIYETVETDLAVLPHKGGGDFTIEQRIGHVNYLIESSPHYTEESKGFLERIWGCDKLARYDHWLHTTKEGKKLLTMSESEKKKRIALMVTCRQYDLNLMDLVYDHKLTWREGYEITRRIKKGIKEFEAGEQFWNVEMRVSERKKTEWVAAKRNEFKDKGITDLEEQKDIMEQALWFEMETLVEVTYINPLAELSKYFANSSTELLTE